MQWILNNWLILALVGGMLFMHFSGHGCGGHSGHGRGGHGHGHGGGSGGGGGCGGKKHDAADGHGPADPVPPPLPEEKTGA